MNPAERNLALSNRPPEIQQRILAKVLEYQNMNADERALRLRNTELRWYLLPLLRTSPTNRMAQLAMIPAEDRQLVAGRLLEWDKLAPAFQQEFLTHVTTIISLTDSNSPGRTPEGLSPAQKANLEAGIRNWQQLSEPQRQRIMDRFGQFFELTDAEKQSALSTLSEAERRQIEKTLREFESLSPPQRAQCTRAFEKYAGLSLAERQQFLKNADAWKQMTPDQRQSWRNLVRSSAMQPLLPLVPLPPPIPPPIPIRPSHATISVATNTD
jgi:hypothetical protein